ncbi:MAG: type II toxin-antitoxin system RelE/ParE family toxin [bacterium]
MRRVFKTRFFARWSRKALVPDTALCLAVDEMERGLIDADLGGNLYKKRIAVTGKGKRGGIRVIVATKRQGVWFFLLGYAKNQQENLEVRSLLEHRRRRTGGDLPWQVSANLGATSPLRHGKRPSTSTRPGCFRMRS